ncbi:MAG: cytochrome c oxidase subunit 3, partial [Spongiibacteraceae bacterium]
TTNDFFMYFYVFTGIHLLHLTVGLFVLFYLWLRLGANDSAKDIQIFECGAAYWHMVDLLWLVLFPLLYMVR